MLHFPYWLALESAVNYVMPVLASDSAQSADLIYPPENIINPPAVVQVLEDLSGTSFGGYISKLFDNVPYLYDSSLPASFYNGKILGSGKMVYSGEANIEKIAPIMPSHGDVIQTELPLVYVNGMDTGVIHAYKEAQAWADKSHYPVICIYHAEAEEGTHLDVLQAVFDKLEIGPNKAAETLSSIMVDAASNGTTLHMAASSRGAIVVSRSLDETFTIFAGQGINRAEIDNSFKVFDIETTGGASCSFRPGPRYIHYVCRQDPIPFYFGLTTYNLTPKEIGEIEKGLAKPDWVDRITDKLQVVTLPLFTPKDPGGESAVIIAFDMPDSKHWLETHLVASYLDHRLSFEEVFK